MKFIYVNNWVNVTYQGKIYKLYFCLDLVYTFTISNETIFFIIRHERVTYACSNANNSNY